MSDCREIEPLFAGYVDGEAPPDQRASVQAHLDACGSCRSEVTAARAAREVLVAGRAGLRTCASDALRARCAAHRAARRFGQAAPRWRTLVPLSLAATVLLAVGSVFLYSGLNQVDALAAQLTADHVKCATIGAPTAGDAVASGLEWGQTYGWPLQVPASSRDAEIEFLTVRRCVITEGRAAHLMYKWRGQPMSVFVLPTPVDALDAQRIVDKFGHEAAMWSSGGRTYVVVARGRRDEIEPVVRYVRAHAR